MTMKQKNIQILFWKTLYKLRVFFLSCWEALQLFLLKKSLSEKILCLCIFWSLILLFLPWIYIYEIPGNIASNILSENAFSHMFGINGYILLFINLLQLYIIFRCTHKRQLILFWNIKITPGALLLLFSIYSIFHIFQAIALIGSLEMFFSKIHVTKIVPLIFSISLLQIICTYIYQRKISTSITGSHIKNFQETFSPFTKNTEGEQNNMKFPF